MSTTVKVPDNIPVSWLQQLQDLNPDVLMLASEPNDDTETQYMSKYFTYGKLVGQVSTDLCMGVIWNELSDLYENKCSLSDYLTGTVALNVSDPYIVSSMTHIVSSDGRHFGMVSCDGYRLSAGMNKVFTNVQAAGRELTVIIPQLGQKTTAVANPANDFISAITDKNGHVQSYSYGKFASVVSSHIGSDTKSVPAGYAVSSVTTTKGVVTAVGAADIKSIVGDTSRVYYKDYTGAATADDAFDLTDLYLMKLKFSQLAALSAAGKVRKDCVYMTTDDPES